VAKQFENPFAGGIQSLNKRITADQVKQYTNNPAYKVTDHGPTPVDQFKSSKSGATIPRHSGGTVADKAPIDNIEAEIDREWMRDAMLSAVPEEKKYAPAPAWKGGRNDPFKMQFDLNSYYPWLKKEEEKDRYG
jgi:hypothetical protein